MSAADPHRLTAEDVRRRLAGTSLSDDPHRRVLPPDFETWPFELKRRFTGEVKAAGVLVPIVPQAGELSVLLTRRAAHLRYHPGQVSFPGGRMEPGDADIEATALREAQEEVGITPQNVEVVGYLDPVPTITGYTVTPVVGLLEPVPELTVDPTEVQHAFEVPLSFLLDERNARRSARELFGVPIPVIEFHYASERIWGATANIVMILREALLSSVK
ncbi:MAG TPA: CoA pyrophosphatase [Woeseiaceae bacterium]|jgi:8-oxo-dGTP pyrophosphatase MutT (NUDIX family)|nr:CoA pyrophosphatase [Woeseiaceae bacterium]